jgi:hypothetical protein
MPIFYHENGGTTLNTPIRSHPLCCYHCSQNQFTLSYLICFCMLSAYEARTQCTYTQLWKHQTLRIWKCDYTQTIWAIFIRPCASLILSSKRVNTYPSRDNFTSAASIVKIYIIYAKKKSIFFQYASNVGPECYRLCLYRIFTGFLTYLSSGLQLSQRAEII